MFDTVIKYNFFDEEDISFLIDNLSSEEYIMNASAKEDNYDVIHTCNKNLIKNTHTSRIIENYNTKLISMVEKIYGVSVLETAGSCIAQYTKGKYIGIHKDWQEDDEWVIKNNKSTVHLSSVLYINDDYLRRGNIFL